MELIIQHYRISSHSSFVQSDEVFQGPRGMIHQLYSFECQRGSKNAIQLLTTPLLFVRTLEMAPKSYKRTWWLKVPLLSWHSKDSQDRQKVGLALVGAWWETVEIALHPRYPFPGKITS
ncbi:hypothetical protein OIU78_001633 [Salix suchowensis]|nr:hypothetical protein OIU78_001633 [Salix suchowensis]